VPELDVGQRKMLTPEELLMREASFSSRSIGIGLTEMRKYDFTNKGSFFHALASLSIGLERLLKILVIHSHRIQNDGAFPTNKELKEKYGHRIIALYEYVRDFSERYDFETDWAVYDEEISQKILEILSDFARFSRYYNLDVLTGRDHKQDEPLVRWEKEVGERILALHPPRSRIRTEKFDEYCELLDRTMSIRHTDTDGTTIRNARSMILAGENSLSRQKYSFYYTYRLVRVLAGLLLKVEIQSDFYPFLYEFFGHFMVKDKRYILRKKVWIR